MPAPAKSQQPKILDEVHRILRVHHYSIHTERSYVDWIASYIHFHYLPSLDSASSCESILFSAESPGLVFVLLMGQFVKRRRNCVASPDPLALNTQENKIRR